MKHFCIFEITRSEDNPKTFKSKFVEDFEEDFSAADDMCQSMNNFRESKENYWFCLRCLEQEEFDDIKNYSPLLHSVTIQSFC